MRKPIVVIGGMGPQASLRFHELLIEKSKKHHSGSGDEFPFIAHFSLPVEDFISDMSKQAAATELINQLETAIEELDPVQITLACNTAHILKPKVGLMQRPEFISMLESVALRLKAEGIKRVGLLASPTTIRTELYENVLSIHGIGTIRPQEDQLRILEAAIRSVIAGRTDGSLQASLTRIASSLINEDAEAILLGCTELPLIFDSTKVRVPVFDCLDIQAEAVIDRQYLYNGA